MRADTFGLRGALRVLTIAIAATTLFVPRAAHAQSFFEWLAGEGTKNTVADRQMVRFDQSYEPGQIIVSFGDRRLYHVTERGRAISYPISVPKAEARWEGTLKVTDKRVNPQWTPTSEMRKENPSLPTTVVGGDPRNPMGVRALYLGSTLYRIHGTDAPSTIGQNVSKGCVRMHNAHVIELYDKVPVGAKVTATWANFKTEEVASERVGQASPDKVAWQPW